MAYKIGNTWYGGDHTLATEALESFRKYDACLPNKFNYKKIVFNPPATIIFWADGTKTVVKCAEGDKFDPEKGIAIAFMKRAFNDSGKHNQILRKETVMFREPVIVDKQEENSKPGLALVELVECENLVNKFEKVKKNSEELFRKIEVVCNQVSLNGLKNEILEELRKALYGDNK